MWLDELGLEATHLIHDRDTKFSRTFDRLMNSAEIKIVKSPVMVPNANAFAESWIATVLRECLIHFACFSLRHADHIVQTFVDFYNEHWPHQGLGNRMLTSTTKPDHRHLKTRRGWFDRLLIQSVARLCVANCCGIRPSSYATD